MLNVIGKKYGRLTVVKEVEQIVYPCGVKLRRVLCVCDCGVKKEVQLGNLRSGGTISCGCYQREEAAKNNTTHGLSGSRLCCIWHDIKKRCNNKNSLRYSDYGGRGITMCDEWSDLNTFYKWAMANGYSDDLTIDRINNDGNYCPGNCKFSTNQEQATNTRIRKDNTSGFVGVYRRKGHERWVADISCSGVRKHIGCFESKEQAVSARNIYVIKNKLPHQLQFVNMWPPNS